MHRSPGLARERFCCSFLKLPDHYLTELRRVGRRRGYPRVAREVYRNVESMIAARALYARVGVPVT